MILLLQAPLVALTKSLGEVTSHAEASLAALQVVFQVNIFLAAVFKFLGVFVTHIFTLLRCSILHLTRRFPIQSNPTHPIHI